MAKKHIIEIVGFPGSGKSYILNLLNCDNIGDVEKLDENSFYQRCKSINILKKMFFLVMLVPRIIAVEILLLKFESEYGVIDETREENKAFIKYFVLQQIILSGISKKYILMDQWNIQFIISLILSSDKPIVKSDSLRKLIRILTSGYEYTMLFYKTDISISVERALSREKKFRMDSINKKLLLRYYSIHQNDFASIGEEYFGNNYESFTDLKQLNKLVKKICREKN